MKASINQSNNMPFKISAQSHLAQPQLTRTAFREW